MYAGASGLPFFSLIGSEMRLILGSRLALLFAILVALAGSDADRTLLTLAPPCGLCLR
jgi:hypothetical protein